MKTIYYQSRLLNIIIGIIFIMAGAFYFLFPFIVNNYDGSNFFDILRLTFPRIRYGMIIFILQIFIISIFVFLIIVGIRFIKKKNIKKLQLNEEDMVYYYIQVKNRFDFFKALLFQPDKVIVAYKDIMDIEIKQNIFENKFKIKLRNGVEHNLPIVFPNKDKEEIIKYIRERI
jgi:hypothetical protein